MKGRCAGILEGGDGDGGEEGVILLVGAGYVRVRMFSV